MEILTQVFASMALRNIGRYRHRSAPQLRREAGQLVLRKGSGQPVTLFNQIHIAKRCVFVPLAPGT